MAATRDNIYKQMATQRTRANLYKAGYKRAKVALQEQQKINAAMTTTLAAQSPTVTTQATTTPPRVFQPKAVKTQVAQTPNSTTRSNTNPNNTRISWNGKCKHPTRTGKVH